MKRMSLGLCCLLLVLVLSACGGKKEGEAYFGEYKAVAAEYYDCTVEPDVLSMNSTLTLAADGQGTLVLNGKTIELGGWIVQDPNLFIKVGSVTLNGSIQDGIVHLYLDDNLMMIYAGEDTSTSNIRKMDEEDFKAAVLEDESLYKKVVGE